MQNSMYYTTSGLNSLPEYEGGGYIDQYGRQQYGLGKLVKKITRPVAKVLDKIVPNEIKPALPFIAAAVPFMLPAGFTMGGLGTLASRAIAAAGANAVSQLSQEGAAERGLNPTSLALSAASGYLSGPTAAQELGFMKTAYVPENIMQGIDSAGQIGIAGSPAMTSAPLSLTEKATNLGLNIGQYGADTMSKGTEAFGKLTGPGEFTGTDALNLGKAYVPGALQASGEIAYNAALDAQKKYEQEMLAMNNLASANKQQQIDYIKSAMRTAGFNDDEISSALTRSGFAMGGNVDESGLMSLKMGGMPVEMDYRAKGGFVPIGKRERADDVPARLSKNEFVFTAKAVRNAGGGDIRKGAKKMYQIMNQLEARA
jgi:hypothetical protein